MGQVTNPIAMLGKSLDMAIQASDPKAPVVGRVKLFQDASGRLVLLFPDGTRRRVAFIDDLPSSSTGKAAGVAGTFVFQQPVPAAVWTIAHGLNQFPAVEVETSAGDVVEGDVHYQDANTIILRFSAPFSGMAFLN